MSNSTSTITQMTGSQASKEVTFNAVCDALSPSSFWGRNAVTTTGLTWGYFGGNVMVDGVLTQIANGTLALTASTTNYVQVSRAGTVTTNTTGFTAGLIPLYAIVTGGSTITSYTDYRMPAYVKTGRLVLAMADANKTLTSAQSFNDILEFTGALTALRDVVVPSEAKQYTVFANVTGGFGVRVKTSAGSGITIADGKRAIVYSDGTNVVRVTADT